MTDFTTAQLATILSALAGSERKPATKAAAMRAIARQAAAIARRRARTARDQLTAPVEPADPDQNGERADGEGWPPPAPAGVTLRPGTKQALIADLLRRQQGATLDELIAATGWLPHTTRAALTGLRHKGCTLEKSSRADGKTAYRIMRPDKATAGDAAPGEVG